MPSKSALRHRRIAPLLALLVFTALAATAQAVHWPMYGGDAGRSGYQPVEEPGLPLTTPGCDDCTVWETVTGEVRTSIVTSAGGGPTVQVVAYGTETNSQPALEARAAAPDFDDNGTVRLRKLADGSSAFDVAIDDADDDFDTFGSGRNIGEYNGLSSRGVTPVDTSVATSLGQLYAVHNDDDNEGPDIQIARIDEATGARNASDFAVPGTDGYTITSSPMITGPAGGVIGGARTLFFLATREGTDTLFRVPITSAGTTAATFGTVTSVDVEDGNPVSSPTLATFEVTPGMPEAYVVVAARQPSLRTFKASDLTPGPVSDDIEAPVGDAMTPVVPLAGSGALAPLADAVYVARGGFFSNNTRTAVVKFTLQPTPGGPVLAETNTSPELDGGPSGLALDQEDNAATPGRLALTTTTNLYTLDGNAGDPEALSVTGFEPLVNGFARTTPAVSNSLGYVTRDNGEQLVFDLEDADLVPKADFEDDADAEPAEGDFSYGQPSISRRFVQFGSSRGVFVYRGTAGTFEVSPAETTEGDEGTRTLAFTITRSGSSADAQTVTATTSPGTATADVDYVSRSQPIAFAAGQEEATFEVTVNGDGLDEPDETLTVTLSAPTAGAVIGEAASATGTIRDNDGATAPAAPPTFSIGDVTANEGNSGTTAFTFTVSKSGEGAGSVTAATENGNATAGSDYAATSQVLTFAAGDTSKTVTVLVNGDTTPESEETFNVRLSAATGGATIGDDDGLGRIVNDDGTPSNTVTGPGSAYTFPRVAPQGFTARTTPTRDRRSPYRYRTTGRLTPPAGVGAAGCSGRVSVQFKRGRATTVSTRRASIRSNCTYSSSVTFSSRRRLGSTGRLKVTVRFLGNTRLLPARAPQYTVRAG